MIREQDLTATFIYLDGKKKQRCVDYKSTTPPLAVKFGKTLFRALEYTPCLYSCHTVYFEMQQQPKKGMREMKTFHAHTKTLERLRKSLGIEAFEKRNGDMSTGEKLDIIFAIFTKMLDEAALGSEQGGGINYHHMLNILDNGAKKI